MKHHKHSGKRSRNTGYKRIVHLGCISFRMYDGTGRKITLPEWVRQHKGA